MLNKKAISPVIATALLMVVAVSAVVGFQNFFGSYSSGLFSKVETQSAASDGLKIELVTLDTFYLKSERNTNLTMLKIIDSSGALMCSFNGDGSVNSTGLIGWWKFDNLNSTVKDYSLSGNDAKLYSNTRLLFDFNDSLAIDRSSYANNGSLNNGVDCTVNGISGKGCYFDGTNDYIVFNNTGLNHSTIDFSFSLWFKSPLSSGNQGIISKKSGGPFNVNGLGWELRSQGNMMEFCINGGVGACPRISISSLIPNSWYHVVVTVSRTENSSKIYLDGILVGNMSHAPTYNDSYVTYLGSGNDGYFNGSIDEVAIYSKLLSLEEIGTLYQEQKALFVEYKDSNLDKSVDLDGIDDYVVISNFTAPNSNELTIFSKVKLKGYPAVNSAYIMIEYSSNYNANNNTFAQSVSYETMFADFINFASGFRQITPTNYSLSQTYEASYLNKYYTIITTFNSSKNNNETLTYKNLENGVYGTHDGRYNNDTSIYFRNSYPLYFSGRAGSAYFFKGEFDEVRIYNRSLTDDEIKNLYWYSFRSIEEGVNELMINNCSLVSGNKYEAAIFTDSSKVEQYFIAK